ncbi:dihydroxy-acid dehydratase [Sporichthya brevicatena]|uniref:Dihydroxy-acid dehydratase n=1 Tax=Sporichthya brevicatena TaxID=171442 RepID=A0ABN1GIU6_9ACTN
MRVHDLAVGDSRTQVLVEDLSRTQIVMYAGASGDFNPMHSDEVFAVQTAGLQTVMAHGQFTMGASARVITGWLETADLTAFGMRFRRQVWPGATLTATATVTSVEHDGDGGARAELSIVTVDQTGSEVVTGYARVREGS